jgi:hypothetical protein
MFTPPVSDELEVELLVLVDEVVLGMLEVTMLVVMALFLQVVP